MKAKTLLIALMLLITIPCSISFAQEDVIELSVPDNMPESYVGYYWIGGKETNGATFVICDVEYTEPILKLCVIQIPNDDYTSLADTQADVGPSLASKAKIASQYEDQVLGTLCDILTLTDGNGNNILKEYSVSYDQNGSSLIKEFHIDLPSENIQGEIYIELIFGVNEDRSGQFPMSDSMELSILIQEDTSVVSTDDSFEK